ncbi:MAG TPA: hypothetical protein VIJ68_04775 [Candidatus Saccharimonadales bacterium]
MPEKVEKIVIPDDEVSPSNSPRYDRVLHFFRGEPWQGDGHGNYTYSVPDIPHVHQAYVEQTGAGGRTVRSLQPETLLVAHGLRASDGRWTFKDGREVSDFIEQYNMNNPAAPIDVAAVCNPTAIQHARTDHAVGTSVGVSGYREGESTIVRMNLDDPATAVSISS